MNSQINLLVFDLDGTLVDSSATIYKSTKKTFEILNIKNDLRKEELDKRIGAHFVDIFEEFNIPVPDFEGFISIYKKVYFDYIDYSTLYPAVTETLSELKKHYKVALLTTKAQDQADLIINHFGLRAYFNYVMGRRDGFPVKPAPEPYLQICKDLNIQTSHSMMIGDSEMDIQCGKNAGAFTTAVTYGYRKETELVEQNPDHLIHSINDLLKISL